MEEQKPFPWWALPATGAVTGLTAGLIGGSMAEEPDWSPSIRAKKLLRCLVLGTVAGAGAEGVRQGFNLLADNNETVGSIRDSFNQLGVGIRNVLSPSKDTSKKPSTTTKKSSYAKASTLTKQLLLKQATVLAPSKNTYTKKQLVYNSLLTKIAATDTSETTGSPIYNPYIIGGGLGALGGMTLYNLLYDRKKQNFNGYLGSALAGTGVGLLGASLYKNYTHKEQTQEEEEIAEKAREEEAKRTKRETVDAGRPMIAANRQPMNLRKIPTKFFEDHGYRVATKGGHTATFVPAGYKLVVDKGTPYFVLLSPKEVDNDLSKYPVSNWTFSLSDQEDQNRQSKNTYRSNLAQQHATLAALNRARIAGAHKKEDGSLGFKYTDDDLKVIEGILFDPSLETYQEKVDKLRQAEYYDLVKDMNTTVYLNTPNTSAWGMFDHHNYWDQTPFYMVSSAYSRGGEPTGTVTGYIPLIYSMYDLGLQTPTASDFIDGQIDTTWNQDVNKALNEYNTFREAIGEKPISKDSLIIRVE